MLIYPYLVSKRFDQRVRTFRTTRKQQKLTRLPSDCQANNDCPYKDCRYLHLHNFAISKRVAQRRQYVSGLLKRYLLQPLADTT